MTEEGEKLWPGDWEIWFKDPIGVSLAPWPILYVK